MKTTAFFLENITWVHWVLAYAGALLYVMMKFSIAIKKCDFNGKQFVRMNIVPFIMSLMTIPVIMIICDEPSMEQLLPITKLTAFLAGYQTNSTLKFLVSLGKKKEKKKDEDESNSN